MIITIDGPAGAGKSTAARSLARSLGFVFLDTGAMYRAVTLAAIREGIDLADNPKLADVARRHPIELADDRVFLDGADVTLEIRHPDITAKSRYAADNPAVRGHLVELQRQFAAGKNVVSEGRDQGTVVFPDAPCKFFITARPDERARRRREELARRGVTLPLEEVLNDQEARDRRDSTRKVGPLVPAPDAIHVDTSDRQPHETAAVLEQYVRDQMAGRTAT